MAPRSCIPRSASRLAGGFALPAEALFSGNNTITRADVPVEFENSISPGEPVTAARGFGMDQPFCSMSMALSIRAQAVRILPYRSISPASTSSAMVSSVQPSSRMDCSIRPHRYPPQARRPEPGTASTACPAAPSLIHHGGFSFPAARSAMSRRTWPFTFPAVPHSPPAGSPPARGRCR